MQLDLFNFPNQKRYTMTFKKGFIIGIFLGLSLLVAGKCFLDKVEKQSQEQDKLDLYALNYQNMDGETVQLSDFSDKNIALNFWATWCKPCVAEFPLLDEMQGLAKEDFVFIVVSDEPIEKIKKFAANKPYEFIYLKTGKFLLNGITSLPQTFILDKEGKMRKHHPTIFEGIAQANVSDLEQWVN